MAVYFDDDTKNASSPGAEHASVSQLPLAARVGRENLADAIPPHESYEGHHRWDPGFIWTAEEEKNAVWKTDLYLLSWICIMVGFVALGHHVSMGADCAVLRSSTRPRQSLKRTRGQSSRGSPH